MKKKGATPRPPKPAVAHAPPAPAAVRTFDGDWDGRLFLRDYLELCLENPIVAQYAHLVLYVREVLKGLDQTSDDASIEELIKPLRKAAGRIGNTGRRPSEDVRAQSLRELDVAKKKQRPMLSRDDRHEEVVAEWNNAHPKKMTVSAMRRAWTRQKQRQKGPI